MKYKTLNRIYSLTELGAVGFLGSVLLNSDANTLTKIVSIIPAVPMVVDALTDLPRGTHHYFFRYLWSKATSSRETRNEVESSLRRERYNAWTNPNLRDIRVSRR